MNPTSSKKTKKELKKTYIPEKEITCRGYWREGAMSR